MTITAPRQAERPAVVAAHATAMGLAALPPTAVGVLAPYLIDDFGVDRAAIGGLVALTSGVAAVLSPLAGRLIDHVTDRFALSFVLGVGILGLAGIAGSPTWPVMCVALMACGICRAGSNPATNRLIAGRVEAGRRGWITGVKQSGETVAVMLGAGLLPTLARVAGWRGALALLSAAACPALVVALTGLGRGTAALPVVGRARTPVRSSVRWLMGYSLLMGAGSGPVIAYLPLFAHQSGGLTVTAAGAVMVLAGVAATVTRVAWTRAAEAAPRPTTALARLGALAAVGTIVLIAAASAGAWAIWVGAALWGASGLGFGSVCMLAVMQESDATSIGKATGMVVFSFAIGSTVTPPLFGRLVDASSDYRPGLVFVAGFHLAAAVLIAAGGSRFGLLREAPVTLT